MTATQTTVAEAARMRRLALFADQIEIRLTTFCREQGVRAGLVDEFVNGVYAKMVDSSDPLPLMELLEMLTGPEISNDIVRGYNKLLREHRN